MSNCAVTPKSDAKAKDENVKTISKIEVADKLTFDSNIKSCFINTIELASILDNMFSPAMRDYVGCKISLNDGKIPAHMAADIPMGKLYVSLYFKDRSNTKDDCPIENVIVRSAGKKGSKFNSLMMMNGFASGRMYDITPETYEALDRFRFFPNRKTNWNNLTSETCSNFGFYGATNQEIVVCITGLDLEKIINEIYGERTDEGIFQYQATPVQIVANVNGAYVVQITQLDVRKLDDLRKQLGGPVTSTEFHVCVR